MDDEANYDEFNRDNVNDSELSEFDDMVSAALGGGGFPRPGLDVAVGHRAVH